MSIEIDIINNLNPQNDDDQNDNDVKDRLIKLLEKKKSAMQISAECHAYLRDTYTKRTKIIEIFTTLLTTVGFILSTTRYDDLSNTINVPMAIITGMATCVGGIKQIVDPVKLAKIHESNYRSAMDLADDIEYVILKNNHTKKTLQQSLELYEEKIKSFRKVEEQVPLGIKQKIAQLGQID